MHILLTGATGYIEKRLLAALLEKGHHVVCCVRNPSRVQIPQGRESQIEFLQYDLSNPLPDNQNIKSCFAAYYLVHSLSNSKEGFEEQELNMAVNFRKLAENINCRQVIYLGGIANEKKLSKHLASRKGVETYIQSKQYDTTILRAAIIVGSGSASFEIIRDLVEKLPIMITPKWLKTRCQPIAIRNVIEYLVGVLGNENTYGQVITYKEMMLQFARVRRLKRLIFTIPVMTPRLSSYWLYFITSTNYTLAINLVNSMKVEVVCNDQSIRQWVRPKLIKYSEAVSNAFDRIEQNMIISSWKDALSSYKNNYTCLSNHIESPINGCFKDRRKVPIKTSKENVQKKLWSIGGKNGWYFADFLWKL
ncbi:MAG: NAD(P)H-binding protein [Flavobacteriales bacterium]